MTTQKILVLDGARTPVGSVGEVFKDVPAHELGAGAIAAALECWGVDAHDPGVVMGCIGQVGQVGQVGPDAYDAARGAVLPARCAPLGPDVSEPGSGIRS